MSVRILLAVAEPELAGTIADLSREDPELEVVVTAVDVGGVTATLGRGDIDVVLLHEGIARLPLMELARDLSTSFPSVAFVLLVEESTSELLRAAIQAGARDVMSLPVNLEDLQSSVGTAAQWARAASSRPAGGAHHVGGATVAVAGAKGGAGASTVAVHLALAAAGAGRSTCLVDFDLQAGDVRFMFDLPEGRSVADLIDVAAEVTGPQLVEALYAHESGLRVLLAPVEGEAAEEIGAERARGIIGAVKFAFDVVVIDIGTVVTDATAVAVELSDEALIVTTPDVGSLRAANRLLALWKRLQVRDEHGTLVVLNRASRHNEVQPDLARRILVPDVLATALPADFRALEPAVNTGVPARLGDGALRSSYTALAVELGIAPEPERRPGRRSLLRSESGQVATELVGMTAVILVTLMALWQIALLGYTYVLADHAAREGARADAVGSNAERVARADVPSAWRKGTDVKSEDEQVEVKMAVPVIVPGLRTPFSVRTSEGTVDEGDG